MYVSEYLEGEIKKLWTTGIITTYATGLFAPRSLALDQFGTLYVTEDSNNVKKIFTNGTIVNLSGFDFPTGVDVDMYGNIYVGE